MKNEIENWKKQAGLSTIEMGDKTEIEYAMGVCGAELTTLSVVQMDEVMSNLANYYLFVSHEMGTIFARVRYLEANNKNAAEYALLTTERAKLNIIKPVHDAIKVKIDLLKKIYERKVQELRYKDVTSSGR